MIFQKVLKGISELSEPDVNTIISQSGIISNWWRKKNTITNGEIKEELTEQNLMKHLNHYNQPLPSSHKWFSLGKTYGDVSPFISTTAGAVQRNRAKKVNIIYPSFLTALKFATKNFRTDGCIFYAYVQVLGKESIPLRSFSEEVRELNIYRTFMPYHQQGEITAKIHIPSVSIEKAEIYNGKRAAEEIKKGNTPTPTKVIENKDYVNPDSYSNIRNYF